MSQTKTTTVRLVSEGEAAEILKRGGSKNATPRTVRWLTQQPGCPARPDGQIDLADIAAYLRTLARQNAPGLAGVARLFDRYVPANMKPRALTYAERQARSRAKSKHADIGADLDRAIDGINWRMRHRAERDFLYFLKTYCTGGADDGAFLEMAPPPPMVPIVRDMEQAIGDSSIPYHIRMPRGHGKTAYTKGGAKWTIATGQRHYALAVGSNSENAENIIDDVFAGITQNAAFIRDFPEIAVPFLKMGGAYQRAKTQTFHNVLTNAKKSAQRIVLPTILNPKTGKPFPSSGAILEAVGFSSGARGKAKLTVRPDFVIFDDLQTDDLAGSDGQVQKAVRKIKKTFMGLAGHRKKIAAIMTSTPIEADDLSETFAADQSWRTKTYKMIQSWPKCHNPEATDAERKGIRDLWREYWDIFTAEKDAGRPPHKKANRFYRKHRKEMDEGAAVLNPENYDPDTEVSGIQHAMNLYFRDGPETFYSEYQMQPPRSAFAFALSARHILSRIRRGVAPGTIPPESVLTVAATDVNPGYALSTVVISFDVQLTAFVVAYHVTKIRIPETLNDVEFDRRVYDALAAHGREIAAQGIPIDLWGIDAGGRQFRPVTRFVANAAELTGLKAVAMLGRAGQNWNPNVRSRIRAERNETILCRDQERRRWIAWNADAYKERAQKAWNAEVGAPGGLSLFDGNANHSDFASQVANEKLLEKKKIKTPDGKDRFAYKWRTKNPHDYGDCVAMCYALAGSEGLTGEGDTMKKTKKRIAIGGRLIGCTPNAPDEKKDDSRNAETPPRELPQDAAQPPQPPVNKPRRRIAIGGRLF